MVAVTVFTLEHPRGVADATLLAEDALGLTWERAGVRRRVASHEVIRVHRQDDPHEGPLLRLDALLARAGWEAAETGAAALLARPDLPAWAASRAAGTRAAARLLRARLEGRGALDALAAWEQALARARGTRLEARAVYGAGEAALLAGEPERARVLFARLAAGDLSGLDPWRWLGELGRLRAALLAGTDPAGTLGELAALEEAAGRAPYGLEAALQARVVRARALLELGRVRAAAELLEPLREDPAWAGSPLLPSLLNTLGAIYLASGGRRPDGTWQPAGLLAALPLHLRVVRYVISDAVERARALAGAAAGLRLTGQHELADMFAAELAARFPQAAALRELCPTPRAPGD